MNYYESNDYAVIKAGVLGYVTNIIEDIGLYPVTNESVLLDAMQTFSYGILFIGLVFNILLIIFVIISVLLIYSLLMITTETKTFDTGVMRLLGLTSKGFVAMVLIQAIMFVVPSIIMAYLSSYPCLYLIYKKLDLWQEGVSIVPGAVATIEAICIGLFIPILSAIIPIQRALSKTLSESLNTARSTLSGTIVVIEDRAARMVPFLVFGILCVLAGITIYIVLP